MTRDVPGFETIGDGAGSALNRLAAPVFAALPPEIRAAVNAYDDVRRSAHGRQNEPPMSDANKLTIAPMILAAVQAYVGAIGDGREDGESRDHNAQRPAERWFMMIKPGDVPGREIDGKETGGGFAARKALVWALAYCEAAGIDPEFPASVEVPALDPQAVEA